nr:DNA polymerase III subunit gamma and tau [Actinoplanes sp. ATCC 53533]
MALALYRKYRPRTFAEVIGQEHVTEPLSQALRSGRLHHAYLFSGPRGCGKTSSARILARSLNCEQGPTPEPCGVCASCKSLTNDGAGSIDVIEIDAASHGGVDDARDLREKAFFAPASSRYKIYVIDEAHMVSSAGFNALLKLVEEPPDYVKFIFATTEPEKVLGTIRSRTHHYPFRLIPPAVLRPYLQQLTEAEGVHVDPAVLPLVVRAGGGSARDTLSVLDQLISGSGPEGVSYPRAVSLLGVTDAALIDEMCDALAAGDGAAAYQTIDRVAEAGHDPRRFASDLLERLRDLIVLQQVPDAVTKGLIDGPADQLEQMGAQATRLGPATLSRCADIVHNGLVDMRGTTAPRLLLELITARMLLPGADDAHNALLQRLERMERRLTLTTDEVGLQPGTGQESPAQAASVPAGGGGGGISAARAAAAAAARRAPSAGSGPSGSPAAPAPAADSAGPVAATSGSAAPVSAVPASAPQVSDAGSDASDSEPPWATSPRSSAAPGVPVPSSGIPATSGTASTAAHGPAASATPVTHGSAPAAQFSAPAASDASATAGPFPPGPTSGAPVSAAPAPFSATSPSAGPVSAPSASASPVSASPVSAPAASAPPAAAFSASAAPVSGAAASGAPVGRRPEPAGIMPDAPEDPGFAGEAGVPGQLSAASIREVWPEIISAVSRKSKKIAALAQGATVRDLEGQTVVLTFRFPAHAKMVAAEPALISDALYEALGGRWQIRCDVAGESGPSPGSGGSAPRGPRGGPAGPAQRSPQSQEGPSRQEAGQTAPSGAGALTRQREAPPRASVAVESDSGDEWPEPARPGGLATAVATQATEVAAVDDEEWPEPARLGGPQTAGSQPRGAGQGFADPSIGQSNPGGGDEGPGGPGGGQGFNGSGEGQASSGPGGGQGFGESSGGHGPGGQGLSGPGGGQGFSGSATGQAGPAHPAGAAAGTTNAAGAGGGAPGPAGSGGLAGGHGNGISNPAGGPTGITNPAGGPSGATNQGSGPSGATTPGSGPDGSANPSGGPRGTAAGAAGEGTGPGGGWPDTAAAQSAAATTRDRQAPPNPGDQGDPNRTGARNSAPAAASGPPGGGRPPSSGLAAARAAAAGAGRGINAAPASKTSAWSDGSPTEEAPYDPEYDGPPRAGAGRPNGAGPAFEGFDPGDEPLDDVIDEKTARQSSEQQAVQLLRDALGAEKISES